MTTQMIGKAAKMAGVFVTTLVLGEIVRRATEQTVDAAVEEGMKVYDDVCYVDEEQKGGLFRKKKTVRRNRFTGKIKDN